jgi:hypothetical protein
MSISTQTFLVPSETISLNGSSPHVTVERAGQPSGLLALPNEIFVQHVFRFVVGRELLKFSLVSRASNRIVCDFLQFNAESIWKYCSRCDSAFTRYICATAGEDMRLFVADIAGEEHRRYHVCMRFYQALKQKTGMTGYPRPGVLFLQEMQNLDVVIQGQQKLGLKGVWPSVRQQLQAGGQEGLPDLRTEVREIQGWMHLEQNQGLLRNISRLICQQSRLPIIPPEIALLGGLTDCDFRCNCIKQIYPGTLDTLSSLRSLNLQGNSLKVSISLGTFDNLPQLTNLNLADNCLENLDPALFDRLQRLERLDLGGNRLRSFQAGLFGVLPRLTTVILCGNPRAMMISSVPAGVLRNVAGNLVRTQDADPLNNRTGE